MKKDQKLLIAGGALLFLLGPSLLKGSNTGNSGGRAPIPPPPSDSGGDEMSDLEKVQLALEIAKSFFKSAQEIYNDLRGKGYSKDSAAEILRLVNQNGGIPPESDPVVTDPYTGDPVIDLGGIRGLKGVRGLKVINTSLL